MPELVYLIEHADAHKFGADFSGNSGIAFSDIKPTLKQDGFRLPDLNIDHLLIDARVPIKDFERYFYPDGAVIAGSGINPILNIQVDYGQHLNDYADALNIHRPDWFRYRTIIRHGDYTQGSVIGYSKARDRNNILREMIRLYITNNRGWEQPFFVITNPESSQDVTAALESVKATLEKIQKAA